MTTLRFTKMHGAGNDVMVVDGIRQSLPAIAPLAPIWGDRHTGVGFDQLLVLRPAGAGADFAGADFRMEIFNPDGSQVEMCANGLRCFFQYLREEGHTDQDEVTVETLSGVVIPRAAGDGLVTVEMGAPVLTPAKIPTTLGDGEEGPMLDELLDLGDLQLPVTPVSMGNPHAVIFVDDVDATAVETLGPRIENHPAFPNRTNVEFVQIVARDRVRQRTWERGTGETLACGSGSCATAVAGMLRGVLDPAVTIVLRGGELQITWDGGDASVFMTGPAARIFDGTLEV